MNLDALGMTYLECVALAQDAMHAAGERRAFCDCWKCLSWGPPTGRTGSPPAVQQDADRVVLHAEDLLARRRQHERRLVELSRQVDAELAAIDEIDQDLAGGMPVVKWRARR